MEEKIEGLKRAVKYGLANGKRNMIVDLDILAVLLQIAPLEYCEHGVHLGDWCEPCNREHKQARAALGEGL